MGTMPSEKALTSPDQALSTHRGWGQRSPRSCPLQSSHCHKKKQPKCFVCALSAALLAVCFILITQSSLAHRKTLTLVLLSSALGSPAHAVPALFLSVIDARHTGVTEGTTPGKPTRVLLPFRASSSSLTSDEADGASLLRRSAKAQRKVFSMGTSTYLSKRCGAPQEESGDG